MKGWESNATFRMEKLISVSTGICAGTQVIKMILEIGEGSKVDEFAS